MKIFDGTEGISHDSCGIRFYDESTIICRKFMSKSKHSGELVPICAETLTSSNHHSPSSLSINNYFKMKLAIVAALVS
jgi:hypothetical protein